MNKRTLTFLAALLISGISVSYSQQQVFYHFHDKEFLNPKANYIAVKFTDNANVRSKVNVMNLLKSFAKKSMDFKSFRENTSINQVLIFELNNNIDNNMFSRVKNEITSAENVESIGYAYNSGGKVIHYTTDEIIVKFKSYISTTDINNLNKYFKTEIIEKVGLLDNVYLLKIESNGNDGKDNVFDVSNKYSLTSLVEFAQPNFIRQGMLLDAGVNTHRRYIPNDTMISQMWHLNNTGSNFPDTGVHGTAGCDMRVLQAWDIATGNPNILLSIVDTGVDTNHTDLKPNLCDRSLWYDFWDNDNKPFDEFYHGTGVSGCALGVANNIAGVAGVAFDCRLMPVRVFGPAPYAFTTDLILAKGISWSWTRGASVINLSWGGGIPTPIITHAIQNAVHYGRSGRGTLVFGGAGNDDTNIVIYPASMYEVIGVGGLSPCNTRKTKHSCDFNGIDSNQYWGACYGDGMELVAPCTFIGTTMLFGDWCICGNGTSVSSPLAAAVAALVLSKNNSLSGDSVRAIIERSCVKAGSYNYNILKEHGYWNNEMGYGRIDARAALDMTVPGSGSIGDQIPPVITIFPPESKVFNSKIIFTAQISDNNSIAGGSNAPRLYYRTIQHPQIQTFPGAPAGGNMFQFTFPLIPYSEGFYYYISAQDVSSVPNVATYPIGGKGANPPGNVPPSKFMFVRNTATYDTTFVSADVPLIIPSNGVSTQFSTLNNVTGKIALDVNCTVNIYHTFIADLTLSLISPSGTEIVILSGIGWDSDSLKNTTLDDEAAISIDDTIAKPPYNGTFKPVEKLWLFDGEPAGGQWKLKVVDNGYGDGGILKSWSLNFKFASIDDNVILPGTFSLVKNYPNPFNPKTRIVFNVPRTAHVTIAVYDVSGRLVKTLVNETRTPKLEDYVEFDANDPAFNGGRGLASGVYFYNLVADDEFIEAKRMVLVK